MITLLCDDDTEYDEYRGATQSHKPGSEFLGKIRYRNPLPALPFAPKLLTPHLNTATTSGSTGTSEEASLDAVSAACAFSLRLWMKKMPQPLLCDAMCGMPLDLVDQDALTTGQSMDADDEALLQPVKTHTEERHRPLVPWLRRTEYISTETARVARTTVSSSPFHQQHQQHVYASPEEEWEAVDRSFEFSLANIKHPTRADLVPTEVLPVFPDFEMWPSSYVHCVFEDAPTNEQNFGEANARLCMDQSFLKAFTGSENTTAASTTGAAQQNLVPMIHYMPTPTALQHYHQQLQLEPDDGGSESQPALEAERAREYNGRLEIRDKHAPLDKMVVVFRPDAGGVFYAGVRGRVQLKKRRRQRGEKRQGDGRPTHLQVKRRELSTGEREQQALEVRHSLNIELPQQ